ncbi:hypothetical protein AsAng_0000620 [Aureispira anguillae]|uniref:Uncharacterized protein n=1 Tax=Aureispira anguillae TaxID=2864201 RepID=A0A915VJV9_9BACT|nr:hypothetical protein AsAng_0000620 [Aureispira anguillae]
MHSLPSFPFWSFGNLYFLLLALHTYLKVSLFFRKVKTHSSQI